MGLIDRKKRYAWISLIAIILIAAACSKAGGPNPNPGPGPDPIPELPGEAEKTPVGTPLGKSEQKLIGAGGGTFTTEDNRITLDFPAGALTADTWITIEQVTNNCPGGSGNVLRISPHNVAFNKPVKLSFNYGDSDFVASAPIAMTIAYQDAAGYWLAAENMVKDTTHKKVWVTTSHFSDWALFKAFELVPYTSVVEPGKQVSLGVINIGEYKNDSLLPVPEPLKKKKGIVKEWRLDGAGTLVKRANSDDAVYTAPGSIPSKNPVAVSAVLNIWSNWQFTLVSNIYIGTEGLVFRIDNGPWQYCIDHDGIAFDGYYWSTTAANMTSPQADGVTIKWAGTSTVHRFVAWGLWAPQFLYGPDPNTTYMQLQAIGGRPSPGGIYFHFGSDNMEYAVATFILDAAQKIVAVPGGIPRYSTHRIEGYFRLKWKK